MMPYSECQLCAYHVWGALVGPHPKSLFLRARDFAHLICDARSGMTTNIVRLEQIITCSIPNRTAQVRNSLSGLRMGKAGLEPARLSAHDPKSCSSASSDTPPRPAAIITARTFRCNSQQGEEYTRQLAAGRWAKPESTTRNGPYPLVDPPA
jgi:hypothetical protein